RGYGRELPPLRPAHEREEAVVVRGIELGARRPVRDVDECIGCVGGLCPVEAVAEIAGLGAHVAVHFAPECDEGVFAAGRDAKRVDQGHHVRTLPFKVFARLCRNCAIRMARPAAAVKRFEPREDGRVARGARTRAAIVNAAGVMLGRGDHVTIDAVAEAARVSRRTIYTYFPALEQLVLDATAGSLANARVDAVFERHADAEARIAALARAIVAMSADTMPLGRALIRLTIEPPQPADGARAARRGYRRVAWIERALEPLRARLTPARFKRLVSALSVVLGWEAMIVLEDVRGLAPREEEAVCMWTARALVRAALDDARACSRRKRTGSRRPRRASTSWRSPRPSRAALR